MALIDIDQAMREDATMALLVMALLIFIGGALLGSALTSWWHERRRPHRAWRYQIARELHGDAKFEPDAPNVVSGQLEPREEQR